MKQNDTKYPILVSVPKAADILGVDKRTLYRNRDKLIAYGLKEVTIGKRPKILTESLEVCMRNLAEGQS